MQRVPNVQEALERRARPALQQRVQLGLPRLREKQLGEAFNLRADQKTTYRGSYTRRHIGRENGICLLRFDKLPNPGM